MQLWHAVELLLSVSEDPGGQPRLEQDAAPAADTSPLLQLEHSNAPVVMEYFPAAQFVQVVAKEVANMYIAEEVEKVQTPAGKCWA